MKRYNDGYGHRRRVAGKQVRVQQVFSKKKLTGPSQTRTRVPVYPPIPEHEYRTWVHGYRLYPADFSKPLPIHVRHFFILFKKNWRKKGQEIRG
jgi:hypothetical protein